MGRRPEVDIGRCTLCQACIAVCPEVFRINDTGYLEVIDRDVYPAPCVNDAIKYCPQDCIVWVSD